MGHGILYMDGGLKASEKIFNEILEQKDSIFLMSYDISGVNLHNVIALWGKLISHGSLEGWIITLQSHPPTRIFLNLEKYHPENFV